MQVMTLVHAALTGTNRGHIRQLVQQLPIISPACLTNEKRYTMETFLRKGEKPASVARDLRIHRSIISP